ncbi:MAG: NAD(P)-dependent oxidoreductase [Deltaproteobacteria bacterium]|nr:NAD(P)-dependent oxidoreductase [Deltaproteobacteria bacterium]
MAATPSVGRIIITGATGFLGRAFMEQRSPDIPYSIVVRRGSAVEGADAIIGDVREPGVWQDAVAQSGATHVVYLAGVRTGSLTELDAVHCAGLRNVLQPLRTRPPWVLFVSSGAVYGEQSADQFPLVEHTLPRPISEYAASKWRAEQWLQGEVAAGRVAGACVVRPANLIGPGMSRDFFLGKLLDAMCARVHRPELLDIPIDVGSLAVSRDFVDVRDVVVGLHCLVRASVRGVFNMGSGRETWLQALVQLVQDAVHLPVQLVEDVEQRMVVIRRQALSVEAIRAVVGWCPQLTLQQSVTDIWHAMPNGAR